jgi:hypothetical protein
VTQQQEASVAANYDEPWKAALDLYFEAFLEFFFPQVHEAIDWKRGYTSLDKEFQRIVRDAELGKRFVDKLVKVWLLNGEEAWLLLHVEIQSQMDAAFEKRMFTYHYRIFDRYGREVVSLAVLGDEQPGWRPHEYQHGRWGCEMKFLFPTVKLLDYAWETLEFSNNPFAVVVMAHRKTQDTTQDVQGRLRWKLTLIKGLYERGYGRQDILELFRLLDWMMRLPESLELTFRDELKQFEEEKQMQYVTSVERIGRQEGRQEERQDMVRSLLVTRFGTLDEELETVVKSIMQQPSADIGNLLLTLSTLSRNEILEQFGREPLQ